jgi:pyoverdine/dityrosine biosynthesis protein Dit1
MNQIVSDIYSILDSYRKNPFAEVFDSTVIKAKLSEFVLENKPIEFVLPAFHGKINNPDFVSGVGADMGDAVGLQNLRSMIHKIGEVYKPGCIVNVVHEAHFYVGRSPLIGSADSVDQYLSDFRKLVNDEPRICSMSIYELLPDAANLQERLSQFASRYEPTAWEIAQYLRKDAYLKLYKAYKKINLEHMKRNHEFMNLSEREKKIKIRQLAILQIQIYFGFGKLVKEYFGQRSYIRLSSLYKSPEFTDCVAINYLPGNHQMSTPTFNCVVLQKDGRWSFIKKYIAEQKKYVLANENGLMYYKEM